MHRGPGEINYPIAAGGVVVNPGDVIVGDLNGVVVVPREFADDLLDRLRERAAAEADYTARSRAATSRTPGSTRSSRTAASSSTAARRGALRRCSIRDDERARGPRDEPNPPAVLLGGSRDAVPVAQPRCAAGVPVARPRPARATRCAARAHCASSSTSAARTACRSAGSSGSQRRAPGASCCPARRRPGAGRDPAPCSSTRLGYRLDRGRRRRAAGHARQGAHARARPRAGHPGAAHRHRPRRGRARRGGRGPRLSRAR